MPAYIFKLSGEINVAKTLDEQAADIAKVKALADAVKSQTLSPDALTALCTASNISIDLKMVSRSPKVKTDEAAG